MSSKSDTWSKKRCVPCEGGVPAIPKAEAQAHIKSLDGWTLSGDGKSISQDYVMKNFVAAVNLIDETAKVAEADNHHPDMHLTGYRKLRIELSTHAINGLSENDFILAAKIDRLPKELRKS